MEKPNTIVVIGGGQAAGWVLKTLRAEGFAGRLLMIAAEPHAPYERPPLSKAVLAGTASLSSVQLISDEEFQALNVECIQPDEAISIDRITRTVHCRSSRSVNYDQLVLATGGEARRLSEGVTNNAHVHYLRTLSDASALRVALDGKRQLVVIGGGWIGLEVAATARKLGLEVTVVEAFERLCARAAPLQISAVLQALHEKNGVKILLNSQLENLSDLDGTISVQLKDGSVLTADVVVAGIGQTPNVDLALTCGLEVDNGIVVDNQGRTSDSLIFSCGDVANQPHHLSDGRLRLESWANAQNQAVVVAKAMLGSDEIHAEAPWFWSDQYDLNLQILGFAPADAEVVVRGDLDAANATLFFFKDDVLCSAIALNNGRDIKVAKRWMAQGKIIDREILQDVSKPLKP
ncbi:NAD(P)/FAD-dependent oxidoreductase [Glaciimonas soli]|uniref:Pyridine nucleotide-disulfide oxidoreductase n=1 Tax=Glaciimonas soli TaxID=2590999 RepID=A0A843YL15_9BURK|nr:FAD-dependent oxidoreductase [Glaciimonas soli]MQQ99629.1 pyridine nucleotide-disulfide oxidoreductase [Glaciimonas soli]